MVGWGVSAVVWGGEAANEVVSWCGREVWW